MKSIQTKLTVTILIIFFTALSILGGLNYWKARTIIIEYLSQDIVEKANTFANNVGEWLGTRQSELSMLASASVVKNGKDDEIVSLLANAVKEHPMYDSLGYTSAVGVCISTTGTRANVADRAWFQNAMKGEMVVTDPLLSRTTGHIVPVIAVPVRLDNKVVGVISGTVNMEGLTNKVLAIKVGQTGYAFVVEADGLRIIHPDKEVAMKSNPLMDSQADSKQKQATERMTKGEKGLSSYQFQGAEQLYAFAPVPGTHWSLALSVPVAEMTSIVSSLTIISLVTIVIVLMVTAVMIIWYSRRIAQPIKKLEYLADGIAAGDLSVKKIGVISDDEIGRLGQAFEKMVKNLNGLIRKVSQTTEQVAAHSEQLTANAEQSAQAATQVAAAITEVAQGAEEQLRATNNTAGVMKKLSASIQQVADNANEVAEQSAKVANKAKEGNHSVNTAVDQMHHIEQTVLTSANIVTKLGKRSEEVGQIVDTISGIAGQTNLLALNAAIEAARAGEQGRGFAVVAEEVRKLAEQSDGAAKQIAQLICGIQEDTTQAVDAMTNGTKEVKLGAEVVNQTGQNFQEITTLVMNVSERVKEISVAIEQMALGSQQILESVKQIDDLSKKASGQSQTVSAATEEQSASMEEIAASSQTLSHMAQNLQQIVSKFQV
jgi:methyl-accepting chemotaxis protein